jgi:hypothetical protein
MKHYVIMGGLPSSASNDKGSPGYTKVCHDAGLGWNCMAAHAVTSVRTLPLHGRAAWHTFVAVRNWFVTLCMEPQPPPAHLPYPI